MSLFTQGRLCLILAGAIALIPPPAPALLNFNGNRNQLYVFGGVTLIYNSNLFANATDREDSSMVAHAGAEMKRRAGIISVDALARVDYERYDRYSDQNTANPSLALEFAKGSGRTTGTLRIRAYRESRSDSAVNLRTDSWNYPLELTLKYPINDKLYVTSESGYLRRTYSGELGLANYRDITESVDLFYVYTSKLDLSGGYRLRISRTSVGSDATDHWLNLGATGGLFAKLNGNVRLGYQWRDIDGRNYGSLSAAGALAWPITRKLSLASQISRDFNTIATGASVNSTSSDLRATYALTRKIDLESGFTYGRNEFLDGQFERRDTFFAYDIGIGYTMNEHLQMGANYSYLRNQSSLSFSDFDRQLLSLDFSSRY